MASETPLLGAHCSIAGGLENALYTARSYGCTALQMFTKNARTWAETPLSPEAAAAFDHARSDTGITEIASHTSYLINLAGPDPTTRKRSIRALREELIRSSALKIPYVVLHPGSHGGAGEAEGMERIITAVNRLFREVPNLTSRLLLETTAGQGHGIGHTFEQLSRLLAGIEDAGRIGVCLDTSHIFAAGYDIRTRSAYAHTLNDFNRIIGLDRLFFIHLNDSKAELGGRVDRHAHIGQGQIGTEAFGCIMRDERLARIPKVIETPKEKGKLDWDAINLSLLRRLGSD
mgnify:FL=1